MTDPTLAAEDELGTMRSWYDEQTKALALAQQAGKCAAWVMDVEKQEVKWIPGGYEIFGRPFSEFAGRIRPIDLIEPADKPAVLDALAKTLTTGAPFIAEFQLRWPNGELHWQETRGVLDPDSPHIIRGTTFDITERKSAEMSLLRFEKLAAVGRIASTIAHEINNPLESVTNLLYLALLEDSLAQPLRDYLLTAQEELARLSNITRLTLSFARPNVVARAVDPVDVIESVLLLFRRRLEASKVEVIFDRSEPFTFVIFADELQRILTNLIANAVDAIGAGGGLLRIVVEKSSEEVWIATEDSGCGISPDLAERIFEPFFTTKEGTGTGIGLWVSRELAEKNGGSIAYFNEPPSPRMRTRFEVRFPLEPKSSPAA